MHKIDRDLDVAFIGIEEINLNARRSVGCVKHA